jgi:hypothetical protein
MGDLKLVERPQNYTLAAGQTKMVRANIKVPMSSSASETCGSRNCYTWLAAVYCCHHSLSGIACVVLSRPQKCHWCTVSHSLKPLKIVQTIVVPYCLQQFVDQQSTLCVNLQVSSTETGVIFGNIVYEGTGYAERSVVVLNDIHIDIMDYISPAVCADVQFR